MPKTFIKGQICDITGIKPRTLQLYMDKDIVPSTNKNKGRGHDRKFSFKSLIDFALIYRLKLCGFKLEEIKQILSVMRKNIIYTKPKNKFSIYGHLNDISKHVLTIQRAKPTRVFMRKTIYSTKGSFYVDFCDPSSIQAILLSDNNHKDMVLINLKTTIDPIKEQFHENKQTP